MPAVGLEYDTIQLSADPGLLWTDDEEEGGDAEEEEAAKGDLGTEEEAAKGDLGTEEEAAKGDLGTEEVRRPQRVATPFLSRKRMRQVHGMPRQLVRQLDAIGVYKATELQSEALPVVLRGQDTVITAETGSGKTLCYVLPYLARRAVHLQAPAGGGHRPRMLVVVPSQELCSQVADVVCSIAKDVDAYIVAAKRAPSIKRLEAADVVVATPQAALRVVGRAAESGEAGLPAATFAVVALDEADLLVGSFQSQVEQVLLKAYQDCKAASPPAPLPQHVMCAATMLQEAGGRWFNRHFRYATHVKTEHLHKASTQLTVHNISIATQPLMTHCSFAEPIAVWRASSVTLPLVVHTASSSGTPFEMLLEDARHEALIKALTLAHSSVEAAADRRKTLVFVNSAMSAEAAVLFLEHAMPHLSCAVLHKRVPFAERGAVHVEFTAAEGDVDVLVATDMASRGLDTVEVGHVIQLECAVDLASFLHRIGRTGRLGGVGVVTNIVTTEEAESVARMMHSVDHGTTDHITRARHARQKAKRQNRRRRNKQQ